MTRGESPFSNALEGHSVNCVNLKMNPALIWYSRGVWALERVTATIGAISNHKRGIALDLANAQCGRAAIESREAYGVRGACSRFRLPATLDTASKLPALPTL